MAAGRTSVYGGQALLEGVLIRGPGGAAVAVRTPGGIVVLARPQPPLAERVPWLGLPVLRGAAALGEAVVLGTDALLTAANLLAQHEGERIGRREAFLTVALSLLLVFGLFFALPTLAVRGLEPWLASPLARNAVEGLVRLAVLLAYLGAMGLLPDIRRVLEYHGAEHKVIHALEAGDRLTPQRVSRYPRVHPRCGTSFLLLVVLVSVLLFGLLGWPSWWQRLLARLLLLPVVAGVAYELLRVTARSSGVWARLLAAPGLWLQRLTTREPDEAQLEVAIRALEAARALEDGRIPCSSGWKPWSAVTGS